MTRPRLTMREEEVWFDRFVLKQIIGQGGMGVVWSAWDRRLDEWVALKFLPELLRWDAAALAALRKETQSARRLSHPHIVRVHDLHENEDGVALAMALIEGETLTSWRMKHSGGVVDPEEIIPWLPGLCSALDYAHQEVGIVHHDIKPANLLLSHDGKIQVTDFGIASTITGTMARISSIPSGGTLTYMSPQQLWDEPAGPTDDVYALGATLYELFCGQPPFVRGDISRQIETRPPRSPSSLRQQMDPPRDALPEQWENLILACLAKQPGTRPTSAGDILQRLESKTVSDRPHPASRRKGWLVLSGIALSVALGLSIAWFNHGNKPSEGEPVSLSTVRPNDTKASPASQKIFGAMGQGMLAHYPFDGSTQDYCSGGYDGTGQNISYVPDRFGNPGNAARIESISRLHMTLGRAPRLDQKPSLTLSSWIRLTSREGIIFRLKSVEDETQGMTLGWQATRMTLMINFLDTSRNIKLPAPALDHPDQWHHVMTAFEGPKVEFYVDGVLVGEATLPHAHIKPDTGYHLLVGKQAPSGMSQMDFALDDLRLWHRALSAESAKSLAMEDHRPERRILYSKVTQWPWDSHYSYSTTAAAYNYENDWLAAVQSEFGDKAEVADWDEVKRAAGPWPSLWAELVSFSGGTHLLRSGQQYFSEKRAYQMERYYASIPYGYLAHSYIGTRELLLGSWKNTMPLLARVPHLHSFRKTSWELGQENGPSGIPLRDDGSWHYSGNITQDAPTAVAKRIWMIELASTITGEEGYTLSLPSGATASLSKITDGTWEISYRSNPDANRLRKSVMMTAKPKLWAIVQSVDRVYQTVVETGGRQTIYGELITADSAPGPASDHSWSLRPLPDSVENQESMPIKAVTKIQYITQF